MHEEHAPKLKVETVTVDPKKDYPLDIPAEKHRDNSSTSKEKNVQNHTRNQCTICERHCLHELTKNDVFFCLMQCVDALKCRYGHKIGLGENTG